MGGMILPGVVKSVQTATVSNITTGDQTVTISAVNPSKAVVVISSIVGPGVAFVLKAVVTNATTLTVTYNCSVVSSPATIQIVDYY